MNYKSKTQKKKDARYLQELGERLLKLSIEQINEIDLPKEIYEAVKFAKTIKSHGAFKRQMQYIGTLMRKIDPGPVQEALSEIDRGNYRKAMEFRETEKWRDDLIAGNNSVMEGILEKYPDADRQQLYQLVRQARKEVEKDKPPRASRALFRYLKHIRLDI